VSGRATLDQFLLRACSPRVDEVASVPEAAWPDVWERAVRHKVANLVLARWGEVAPDLPDGGKSCRRVAAVQNLAMAARLLELLDVFGAQKIAALPFKGAVLAETVFGGLGNRSFGDLDVLLPRADLARACGLLVDLGYRPIGGVRLEDYLRITLRAGHHVCLQHERHRTLVELHWEMTGRYLPVALDFATVRPFLERIEYRGREIWNLKPEIGLLYLCVHAAKEYWRILDHVVCVVWHMERSPPDWDALVGLARQWGGTNILLVGLGLAEALFAVTPPERIRRMVNDVPAVQRLVSRQSQRVFDNDRLMTLRLGNLPEFLRMHWTQLGDAHHFVRWMARRLTTPAVEDLEPGSAEAGSPGWKSALAPVEAVRRLFRGQG
jgi:hypothetical protein